jgi:cathepsin L
MKEIIRHNQDKTQTWKMGVNQFTDRTDAELKEYLGARPGPKNNIVVPQTRHLKRQDEDDVDWRDQGVISAVKDQGRCGSCWSFAATESVESYAALSEGFLRILSEQQVLDCTPNPDHCGGSGGCGGATVELAFQQLAKSGGLASEWTYPYVSYFGEDHSCNATRSKIAVKVKGYANLPANDYEAITHHLLTKGPLAVSVDASEWFMYEEGVFNSCNQTNPDLDHAVQLVGMGTDDHLGDYWLVRNSWSPAWGEVGYIRLYRSSTVQCGTDLTPGDGDGCTNGPPTEYVCGTCGILYDAVYPVVAPK